MIWESGILILSKNCISYGDREWGRWIFISGGGENREE
jgi:hypothetical protein